MDALFLRFIDKLTGFFETEDNNYLVKELLVVAFSETSISKNIKRISNLSIKSDVLRELSYIKSIVEGNEDVGSTFNLKRIKKDIVELVLSKGSTLFIDIFKEALEERDPSDDYLSFLNSLNKFSNGLNGMKNSVINIAKKENLFVYHDYLIKTDSFNELVDNNQFALKSRITIDSKYLEITENARDSISLKEVKEFYRKRVGCVEDMRNVIIEIGEVLPEIRSELSDNITSLEEQEIMQVLYVEVKLLKEYLETELIGDFFDIDNKIDDLRSNVSSVSNTVMKEAILETSKELIQNDRLDAITRISIIESFEPNFTNIVEEVANNINNVLELNNEESTLKDEYSEIISKRINEEVFKQIGTILSE